MAGSPVNVTESTTAPATLVLLPGMHGTADLLGPFIRVLPADQPYRIVPFPTDHYLSYDDLFSRIERELQDVRQMVVIGESYSGTLAVRLAAKHPGRVRAAVMSGGFVLPPFPSWLRWLVGAWLFRLPLPSFAIRLVVAGWKSPDSLVDLARIALREPTPQVMAKRAIDALMVNDTDALKQVRPPLLYFAGDHDWLVWPFNLSKILSIRPDVSVRRFDAPHLILQTVPDQVLREIQPFLRQSPHSHSIVAGGFDEMS